MATPAAIASFMGLFWGLLAFEPEDRLSKRL
jgi:hypothetical protein